MPKRVSVKGRGADLFFGEGDPVTTPPESAEPERAIEATSPLAERADAVTRSDEHETASKQTASDSERKHASRQASAVEARPASPHHSDVIEQIRKTVKVPGREVAFVRLTPEEKGKLADIVYTYKRQGVKTSENEINRIAVSYLMHDYQACGEESILAKVIAALKA